MRCVVERAGKRDATGVVAGDYVWVNHCHILMHEDHGMMQAVQVLAQAGEANYRPRTGVASHRISSGQCQRNLSGAVARPDVPGRASRLLTGIRRGASVWVSARRPEARARLNHAARRPFRAGSRAVGTGDRAGAEPPAGHYRDDEEDELPGIDRHDACKCNACAATGQFPHATLA